MVREFYISPVDQGSIPDRVIPKTQKMALDIALLNSHPYKVRIKDKSSIPGKRVAPAPALECSSP